MKPENSIPNWMQAALSKELCSRDKYWEVLCARQKEALDNQLRFANRSNGGTALIASNEKLKLSGVANEQLKLLEQEMSEVALFSESINCEGRQKTFLAKLDAVAG